MIFPRWRELVARAYYNKGNISDVLLKFQQPTNQYNTKELPPLFSFTHYRDKRF